MAKPVVIVESPAKARTISGFLGDDYVVESSIGHIRDLPRNAQEIPQAYRNGPWARLGVDVENGFKPLYVVAREKKTQVNKLRSLVKEASEVYLATDEDREGESIAWHLLEVLAPKVPVKRMVFHEITPTAIQHAIENWRDLDRRLVDAQEARRILDRLYGYELSPVLWKKVMPRLSAGRVQSVATRMLVERERARMHFRSATWWSIQCRLSTDDLSTKPMDKPIEQALDEGDGLSLEPNTSPSEQPPSFVATVVSIEGNKLATGKDFSDTGELKTPMGLLVLDQALSQEISLKLREARFEVLQVTEKPYRKSPPPPFMTSTLQQEAGRKLRFSASRTMQVAQRLYEQGYITYMRTDSTALADTAVEACRQEILKNFGKEYLPAALRYYKSKVKNAQEAHEAIRPAGERFKSPASVRSTLSNDEYKLYELVWQRTVASQMVDAVGTTAQVRIKAELDGSKQLDLHHDGSPPYAELTASGRVITFPGFLKAYTADDDNSEDDQAEGPSRLPSLSPGQSLELLEALPEEHSTQPPARYTEASLVKALEEMGVGRPSTYASIIATIQERGYVWKKGMALAPSFIAFAVVGLLEQYFPELVDYGFTASMEDDLDEIAKGHREMVPWLEEFYFGEERLSPSLQGQDDASHNGNGRNGNTNDKSKRIATRTGLKTAVAEQLAIIDARDINSIPIGSDKQGVDIVVRVGRYGPYLQRGDERAPVPNDMCSDELTVEVAERLLSTPSEDRVLGTDPTTGELVIVKAGRFGPYVQLGEGDSGKKSKPRTASLFKSMSIESITLDQALSLLDLPRVVGKDPATGEEILAANGRFGPYLKKGKETRSLESEQAIFTIDLEEAIQLFAQPKVRSAARKGQEPLKELGPDPETGAPMILKDGRFGPYVTDGTVNASLRRGDSVESLTAERAAELLAERRAAVALAPPRSRRASQGVRKTAEPKS